MASLLRFTVFLGATVALAASCGTTTTAPLATADPGVIFTYPGDKQLDVPVGSNVVVTFSEKVVAAGVASVQILGPDGNPLAETPVVTPTGDGVLFKAPALKAGATYGVVVGSAIDPQAKNLPSGPLFTFTTRTESPRAAAPTLVAIDGADPATFASAPYRPLFETSTIRLVFSEPLDVRTVTDTAGSIQLLDGSGTPVAVQVIQDGIHVAIDPVADLASGGSYMLKLGAGIRDIGGTAMAPVAIPLTVENSLGTAQYQQVLRTRGMGDPGPATTRSGVDRNVVAIQHPLIGAATQQLKASALHSQLGDPKALDGPIAFTIRKGNRLLLSGLDVKLGGALPSGLTTDDITIEFLTDADGRLYRNPHQPAAQRPENLRAPVYVDLTLDVAIYAKDPGGNGVLTQTILGVQATGTAIATDGVLAIETVASMNLNLLGLANAPANFVMELITDATATPAIDGDVTPPTLLASFPDANTDHHPSGAGISLIFDEPIDLARASAGGITLRDASNNIIPTVIESHGAAVVVRPMGGLPYAAQYKVRLDDVADVQGNALPPTSFGFKTEPTYGTNIPLTVTAVHPGTSCALANDRCAGADNNDDTYQPFALPANEPIEVAFTQPLVWNSITLGTACGNTGSVLVELVGPTGACQAPVPGTLVRRDRSIAFFPDQPWEAGTKYRLSLISGGNTACGTNEFCGISGQAASWDPLSGATNGDGGGPNLVMDFIGTPATTSTFMMADTSPFTDVNGSNVVEGNEVLRDENRAALRIIGTEGSISAASFQGTDCGPMGGNEETCMYLQGTIPAEMGELSTTCPLADGQSAAQCIPVLMTAQTMYTTSVTMDATLVLSVSTATGVSVMRVREPAGGPMMGYIVDRGGVPTMVAGLELYMDAPDMSILGGLASHDLHSKQLSLVLSGPVTFLDDGRIAIALANTADVPIQVNVSATIASGAVDMILPKGEMKLQLVTRPLRGGEL